jgi:phosphatidylglycerol:prolipoprotein diacylglycerol transferase
MTVYPFLIHFGRFTITGYGIMLMAAFLMAGWVFAKELQRVGKDSTIAWDSVVFAVIGGLLGGKIYYALLVHDWSALFSRGGLVWYGGFIGGVTAVSAYVWWKKLSIPAMGDLVAPGLAVGYAVGRVGCFLVGDDYGVPTTMPWGVIFPMGSPPTTARNLMQDFHVALPPGTPPEELFAVHPTQLYEVFIALAIFLLLWRTRRHRHAPGWLLGVYLALTGMERMFVEIFRAKDDRILGPFTLAQAISVLMVGVGAWMVVRAQGSRLTADG